MSTRNIVPRADGEGSIGTSAKQWGNGFFKNLTVGALTKAVSVLVPADDANDKQPATTSWVRARFRSILETVLKAAGLKYNMAQNGYICFGDLFGGLIIQWGIVQHQASGSSIFFPIEFLQKAYIVGITDISDGDDNIIGCYSAGDITNTKFTIKGVPVNTSSISSYWALWFCIGQ